MINAMQGSSSNAQIVNLGGSKTVVMLEDNHEHIDAARKILEPRGYSLIVGSEWQLALQLADYSARFFVFDIKLGEGPERVKGGLLALEKLRLRFGKTVFVAIITVLKTQNANAIDKLGPNIALEKSPNRAEDFEKIIAAYEAWLSQGPALPEDEICALGLNLGCSDDAEADLLFPSDELAKRIAGVSLNDLALLLRERVLVAKLLTAAPPDLSDIEREIGARMRDELRGVLVELAERAKDEGNFQVSLAKGQRLARDLVRLIFRVLPIYEETDSIRQLLHDELQRIAIRGYTGEWGVISLQGTDEVILDILEEGELGV